MNRKCIYTFIVGDYDNVKEPKVITPGWDYICVTDNPNLKSKVWKFLPLDDYHSTIQPLKKRAMSLMIDHRSYIDDTQYDIVVTIGGQMVINTNLDAFLSKYGFSEEWDICLLKHPNRDCVYDEGDTIIQVGRDSKENIEKHVRKYRAESYPENNGLYATGVMIINNKSDQISSLFMMWFNEYRNSPSVRDQMSLNYSIWKLKRDYDLEIYVKELDFKQMIEIDRDIYTEPHKKGIKDAMENTNVIDLEEKVNELYSTPSDINEHIPTIIKYGQECDHITEMGVRWVVSTWAWLATAPKKLISYDLYNPSHWGADISPVVDTARAYDLDFEFIQADILKTEIEETDLLFIDTWHAYDQLKEELKLHADKVRKYICFHDTTSFEYKDEPLHHENSWGMETSNKGIWPAIEEFLEDKKDEWKLKERFKNNNGFTIIERIK